MFYQEVFIHTTQTLWQGWLFVCNDFDLQKQERCCQTRKAPPGRRSHAAVRNKQGVARSSPTTIWLTFISWFPPSFHVCCFLHQQTSRCHSWKGKRINGHLNFQNYGILRKPPKKTIISGKKKSWIGDTQGCIFFQKIEFFYKSLFGALSFL